MINIDGNTKLIAHLGYPTSTFKSSMIYNPYFEKAGINAVVVPMGVEAHYFEAAFPVIFKLSNIHGALITMPHKVSVVGMLDCVSTNAKVARSCNAVRIGDDGALIGDIFDGEGFVRGLIRKGQAIAGKTALVVGAGGVGSAIAASVAGAGASRIALYDIDEAAMEELATRLSTYYPQLALELGSNDPSGFDIIVNATPLGMSAGDPLPVDIERIDPSSFVADVVMKQEMSAFLSAARKHGCRVQVGIDMLFEQIPAYLEFFGFAKATPEELRSLARISY